MLIEVNNLSKNFEYYKKEIGIKSSITNLFKRKILIKRAVKDINFGIEEGEMIGLLGPNGSGKTTTLKMLSGILHPTNGSATVMGYIPWERKKRFKMQFGIVMGQKTQLWMDLPANESLYLNKCIYEIDDNEFYKTVDELAEILDVKHILNVQVRRLSLGERMKLELIASLLHRPKVLFLDEPTIGLDIISQRKIREFLKYYNEQTKTTVILTSHYMKDVEDLCKRTIVLNDGKIVYDGELYKVNELFSQKKIIKIQLSEYRDKEIFDGYGTVRECKGYSAIIEVNKSEVKSSLKNILDGLPVVDFNIEDIPIEEGISILYQKDGTVNENLAEVL
ncbi:MAG: ATP-binding cassette domain-containing protein [Lutisporaceae bacterium]